MLPNLCRHLVAAVLAVGLILGIAPAPAEASQVPATSLVQTVQYYGPGPGYYRGPPRGYYGRPIMVREVMAMVREVASMVRAGDSTRAEGSMVARTMVAAFIGNAGFRLTSNGQEFQPGRMGSDMTQRKAHYGIYRTPTIATGG